MAGVHGARERGGEPACGDVCVRCVWQVFTEHASVAESRREQTEPIDLDACLAAFTRVEELGDDEQWYCSKCKQHQLASKKLQIWKLPPVLVRSERRNVSHDIRS